MKRHTIKHFLRRRIGHVRARYNRGRIALSAQQHIDKWVATGDSNELEAQL